MSDLDSDGGVPLIEVQFDVTSSSKKRKREAEAEAGNGQVSKKTLRKAKRKERKKQKEKAIKEDDLDEELGVNHAFEMMDGQLLVDYVNARTQFYDKSLSGIELYDRFVSASNIRDTTSWAKPRTLDNLSSFLKTQCGALPAASKPPGAPHTVVVTSSGIRAADVCRALKSGLPKEGVKNPEVAKLFAKHLKLPDQVAYLKKNKIDFGVGTPDRLCALLDEKALSVKNLKRVVIDVSYIDQKKRGILDMKDLHEALIKLLLREEFKSVPQAESDGIYMFY